MPDAGVILRSVGLHDESAEHVLFGCNFLNQEIPASFGDLFKGRKVPEVGLERGNWRFLDL